MPKLQAACVDLFYTRARSSRNRSVFFVLCFIQSKSEACLLELGARGLAFCPCRLPYMCDWMRSAVYGRKFCQV